MKKIILVLVLLLSSMAQAADPNSLALELEKQKDLVQRLKKDLAETRQQNKLLEDENSKLKKLCIGAGLLVAEGKTIPAAEILKEKGFIVYRGHKKLPAWVDRVYDEWKDRILKAGNNYLMECDIGKIVLHTLEKPEVGELYITPSGAVVERVIDSTSALIRWSNYNFDAVFHITGINANELVDGQRFPQITVSGQGRHQYDYSDGEHMKTYASFKVHLVEEITKDEFVEALQRGLILKKPLYDKYNRFVRWSYEY